MRKGETDATVASVQSTEPEKGKVDFDESDQNTVQEENPMIVDSSNPEQMSETSKEVDELQTDLPADQSPCPDNQSTNAEVV